MQGFFMAGVVVLAGVVTGTAPPPTEHRPVTDVVHGVSLTDPFQWLEGDNSDPSRMGAMTDEVASWTDAQNAYTRSVLDGLPGRKALEERLRPLMEVGSISTPAMRGNRYFYSKREGSQAQAIIYLREGAQGEPRVLLDPAAIDPSGLTTISWYVPSHDGRLLAFGMFAAGDENSTCYVLDVDRGVWLADEIPGKVGGVDWLPDSSGFVYRCLDDIKNPYSGRIRFHRLGTHHRQDVTLFSQYAEGPLSTTYGPYASLSRDGRWLMLGYYTDTRNNDLYAVDFERWQREGGTIDGMLTPIVVGEKAQSFGTVVGDTLFMQTTLGSPNGRVVAVDLNAPARENWREIIPERKDAVLQSAGMARGIIAAAYLRNAATEMRLFRTDGTDLSALELPGIGSAGLATEEGRTEAFLSYSSFNEPTSIYRVDLTTGERSLWERPDVPVDPSLVEVKQVWYESRDGTKVSMFVVHRKGLTLSGDNPTILYGYGGFNISQTPFFSATMFPWFEAGGVFAVANLRGGGEYGQTWHEGGMLANKQNVFDDFIAAGEWLIREGYTRPERLGISGGSNGGLLTTAALTQRPDLFAAAISAVPLIDMIRYQYFLMARYWVPEYGSSEDPAQFEYLIRYSPYQAVRPGVRYPAVLLTAGENDSRVHPMHARKMAAALQAVAAQTPDARPVLLWVDRQAGHGAGKPLHLRIRDVADQRIFMMWQLGMLDGSPSPR